MTSEVQELRIATNALPAPIRHAMTLALRSGWYRIRPGSWGNARGVCPVGAAARMAGVWRNGNCAAGGPEWGTDEDPSEAVWEFAISFDICAGDLGVEKTVELVLAVLTSSGRVESTAGPGSVSASAA